jgi:DNA-binding NarL/FixJ family response regulator
MKKTVLIVTDNKDDFFYVSNSISAVPGIYKFIYAANARNAILKLKRDVPDIIFARFNLPAPGSLHFVSAVKYKRKWWGLKVYLFDDTITEQESKMAETLGASGCIEKKADVTIFIRELKAVLQPDLIPGFIYLPRRDTNILHQSSLDVD